MRFSTDDEDSEPVWVKLAPSMQTVPEIGVTVLVTRAQDESELPEIQSGEQDSAQNVRRISYLIPAYDSDLTEAA